MLREDPNFLRPQERRNGATCLADFADCRNSRLTMTIHQKVLPSLTTSWFLLLLDFLLILFCDILEFALVFLILIFDALDRRNSHFACAR